MGATSLRSCAILEMSGQLDVHTAAPEISVVMAYLRAAGNAREKDLGTRKVCRASEEWARMQERVEDGTAMGRPRETRAHAGAARYNLRHAAHDAHDA